MKAFSQNGHLNLSHLFWLRCLAIVGQIITIVVAEVLLGTRLPLIPMFIVVGVEVVFNAATLLRMARPHQESNAELFGQLCVDLGALTALLMLSGGTINPFFSLYLPALAIGAAVLPWPLAIALAVFAVLGYLLLATQALPLTMLHPEHMFRLYRTGSWVNFFISVALIAWFVARTARALRQREAALAEAEQRLLRDERVVALGTQAATIAHEMGTPLSTIALLAEELLAGARSDAALAPYQADFVVLENQIALCKEALLRLQSRAASPNRRRLTPWLASFVEQWRLRHPHAGLTTRGMADGTGAEPMAGGDGTVIRDTVSVGQILTILLDNAARASGDDVAFEVEQRPAGNSNGVGSGRVTVFSVTDRGPGIPAFLKAQIGIAPVPSTQGGAGVGLYLAFVTAARLGGTIVLEDASTGGTRAILTLPVERAEAPDE